MSKPAGGEKVSPENTVPFKVYTSDCYVRIWSFSPTVVVIEPEGLLRNPKLIS
jgi:hypothetical protein